MISHKLSVLAYPTDHRIEYSEPSGVAPGRMSVYYHRPRNWRPEDGDLLVVLHGADRDAKAMLNAWRAAADAHNFLLIAPKFSEKQFPGVRFYNLANTVAAGGLIDGVALSSVGAVDRAVDAVRISTGAINDRFTLYAFSAGAQFALRILLLTGAPRSNHVILSSAGWYTLPLSNHPWPCGLGGLSLDATSRANVFLKRVTVQLGRADTNTSDYFGDDGYTDCAREQGLHRLARGLHFFEVSEREAARRNDLFAWRLALAPSAHSIEKLAEHAASAILKE